MTDAPVIESPREVALPGGAVPFRELPKFTSGSIIRSQLLTNALIGIAIWLVALLMAQPLPSLHLSFTLSEVGWGLAAGCGLLLFNLVLSNVMNAIPALAPIFQWLQERNAAMFGTLPIATLFLLSFLAGLFEEVMWRGWLQGLIGLVATALLFALIHFPPGKYRWGQWVTWGMIAMYLPTAFALGYLFQWRHADLTAPMVAHWTLDIVGLGVMSMRLRSSQSAA